MVRPQQPVQLQFKVNAQSSSNTITIQFMNSSGGTIGSPSTFTGSATKEFALTPGAHIPLKLTESDGTNTVSASISFTVGGNSNPGDNNKNISF